jgi:hypothetical protein
MDVKYYNFVDKQFTGAEIQSLFNGSFLATEIGSIYGDVMSICYSDDPIKLMKALKFTKQVLRLKSGTFDKQHAAL